MVVFTAEQVYSGHTWQTYDVNGGIYVARCIYRVPSAIMLHQGHKASIHLDRNYLKHSSCITNLPASMVALSLLPSSEPEATIALSMSPVAKWQTQYFSASRGACQWGRIWKLDCVGKSIVQLCESLKRIWSSAPRFELVYFCSCT